MICDGIRDSSTFERSGTYDAPRRVRSEAKAHAYRVWTSAGSGFSSEAPTLVNRSRIQSFPAADAFPIPVTATPRGRKNALYFAAGCFPGSRKSSSFSVLTE